MLVHVALVLRFPLAIRPSLPRKSAGITEIGIKQPTHAKAFVLLFFDSFLSTTRLPCRFAHAFGSETACQQGQPLQEDRRWTYHPVTRIPSLLSLARHSATNTLPGLRETCGSDLGLNEVPNLDGKLAEFDWSCIS